MFDRRFIANMANHDMTEETARTVRAQSTIAAFNAGKPDYEAADYIIGGIAADTEHQMRYNMNLDGPLTNLAIRLAAFMYFSPAIKVS